MGAYDNDLNYVDDWQWVAKQNLLSPTGFWFDAVTSIPWSFLDLHSSSVCSVSCHKIRGYHVCSIDFFGVTATIQDGAQLFLSQPCLSIHLNMLPY